MRRLLLYILLSILYSYSSAKEAKIFRVKSVRGEYSVVLSLSDVTGREAMQLARDAVRRKALEEVCGSKVSIWDQIETSSAGDTFNSLSINQIDGEIIEFNILEEGHYQSKIRCSETIFYCVADVAVKKGLNPDPAFTISVSGLKGVYYAGDILQFEILPHKDCYMIMFLIENDNVGYPLYPNVYDKSRMFVAGEKFNIANAPNYEFVMQKNPSIKKEINRLLFVFTKQEYNFSQQTTSRQEIEKWIASIPNNEKYIHFAIIEIRDN